MDEHELRELLGLIDADGPAAMTGSVEEPAYWGRLRREITLTATEPLDPNTADATLVDGTVVDGTAVEGDIAVIELRPAAVDGSGGGGWHRPLLVAAAVIVVCAAGWVLAVDSRQPNVESAVPGSLEAFCRQFPAAGVDTIVELDAALADHHSSDVESVDRLIERIDQLVAEFDRLLAELPAGGYDDERAGLVTARGSIAQARLEVMEGTTDAATRSVGNARDEVGLISSSADDLDACLDGLLGR